MRTLIRFIAAHSESWVQLRAAAWPSNTAIVLDFAVRRRRRGPEIGRWRVTAKGVREYVLNDADGGGLQFVRGRHPVLQQYTDRRVAMRLGEPVRDAAEAVGLLWAAHVALVDDWIAADRYLGSPGQLTTRLRRRGFVCRGPAFLICRYRSALLTCGAKPTESLPVTQTRPALRLLHFGSSFVVAAAFKAEQTG